MDRSPEDLVDPIPQDIVIKEVSFLPFADQTSRRCERDNTSTARLIRLLATLKTSKDVMRRSMTGMLGPSTRGTLDTVLENIAAERDVVHSPDALYIDIFARYLFHDAGDFLVLAAEKIYRLDTESLCRLIHQTSRYIINTVADKDILAGEDITSNVACKTFNKRQLALYAKYLISTNTLVFYIFIKYLLYLV